MKTSLDPTTITAKQFRTDLRLPYPFFLEQQQWSSYAPFTSNGSRENTKNVYSIRQTNKKRSDSKSSRKNNRSETGFFIPNFRLHNKWPRNIILIVYREKREILYVQKTEVGLYGLRRYSQVAGIYESTVTTVRYVCTAAVPRYTW